MAVIIERYNYELNLSGVPDQPWPVSLAGGSVSVSGSAPANGLTGSPVPTYADYIGARNGAGNLAGVAFGQQAMAASLPVVLASDQPAVPVTGSLALSGAVDQGAAGVDPWPVTVSGSLPLPANAAQETGGNLAAAATVLGTTTDATVQGNNTGTINARLRGISVVLNSVWDSVNNWFKVSIQNATLAVTQSGSWVLSAGSALIGKVTIRNSANSADIDPLSESDFDTKIGSLTETAPGNDTASSGLNGRLQRIAQRLTSLIALVPAALTAGGNFKTAVLEWTAGVYGLVKQSGYENGTWSTSHFPAENTVATITRAAAGGGIRNVCTSITVMLAAGATAPAAIQVNWKLIDGASGGGTVLDGGVLSLPAVAGAVSGVVKAKCWIEGSANTQMTLEFSAAGGANTIESVALVGTTR